MIWPKVYITKNHLFTKAIILPTVTFRHNWLTPHPSTLPKWYVICGWPLSEIQRFYYSCHTVFTIFSTLDWLFYDTTRINNFRTNYPYRVVPPWTSGLSPTPISLFETWVSFSYFVSCFFFDSLLPYPPRPVKLFWEFW